MSAGSPWGHNSGVRRVTPSSQPTEPGQHICSRIKSSIYYDKSNNTAHVQRVITTINSIVPLYYTKTTGLVNSKIAEAGNNTREPPQGRRLVNDEPKTRRSLECTPPCLR